MNTLMKHRILYKALITEQISVLFVKLCAWSYFCKSNVKLSQMQQCNNARGLEL